MRGNTFVYKIKGIVSSPIQIMYEKAEVMSAIISFVSFSISAFASDGTHL